MTALWTWQQDWRTPEREYDLLENWVNWPAMSAHSLQGPGTFARHVLSDEFKYSLSKEFHTYSMEWKKDDSFSYWLDNRHLVTWKDSTRPDGQRVKLGRPVRREPDLRQPLLHDLLEPDRRVRLGEGGGAACRGPAPRHPLHRLHPLLRALHRRGRPGLRRVDAEHRLPEPLRGLRLLRRLQLLRGEPPCRPDGDTGRRPVCLQGHRGSSSSTPAPPAGP